MEKIGKNKAPSYDGMTDIIFQKKYYNRISIRGYKPGKEDPKETLEQHIENVKWTVAHRLKEYINFCIKEKSRLLYNQDLLE